MREKEFLPSVKTQLGIETLNPMQKKMMESAAEARDIILLSPTGSGKTLAFILPMLKSLKAASGRVQAVVITPSRELVLQITGILRKVAIGFKTTELYGGHKAEDEINSLKAGTDIIVATPGRLADHLSRRTADVLPARILVLDEFDKSLELGFEKEMKKITGRLKNVSRTFLTSATKADVLPDFLELRNPVTIDFLGNNKNLRQRQRVHRVDASGKDKLESLHILLDNLAVVAKSRERSIIFLNHRESAERTFEYLKRKGVPAVLYHGALDQRDRETALTLFDNGSKPVLVATDLAARGLDIAGVKNVIHYHQPLTADAYTHRNGRTARVEDEGDIYVLVGPDEDIKEYVDFDSTYYTDSDKRYADGPAMGTLYISAGRKEKLSKGDILGFLVKEGGLVAQEVGRIDVFDHYSLVAVPEKESARVLSDTKGKKIKGEKRLISLIG